MNTHVAKVSNCYMIPRPDHEGCMFYRTPDHIIPNLDGYAIIPVEEYNRLKSIVQEPI